MQIGYMSADVGEQPVPDRVLVVLGPEGLEDGARAGIGDRAIDDVFPFDAGGSGDERRSHADRYHIEQGRVGNLVSFAGGRRRDGRGIAIREIDRADGRAQMEAEC